MIKGLYNELNKAHFLNFAFFFPLQNVVFWQKLKRSVFFPPLVAETRAFSCGNLSRLVL